MTAVWRIVAAVQRSKEVRTQGESRYERKVHCLKNKCRGTNSLAHGNP